MLLAKRSGTRQTITRLPDLSRNMSASGIGKSKRTPALERKAGIASGRLLPKRFSSACPPSQADLGSTISLVGEVVLRLPHESSSLQKGAGKKDALKQKGNFGPSPHYVREVRYDASA
jgi:hypothetical protein